MAASSAQVSELERRRQQVQSIVLENSANTWSEIASAKEAMSAAQDTLTIQERRLKRVLLTLEFGNDQNVLDLVSVVQDRLNAQIAVLNATAAARLAHAKLERLLLTGPYQRLSAVFS